MPNLSSYKGILETLIEIEAKEEAFRKQRFYWSFGFIFSGLAILIGYIVYKGSADLLIEVDIVGIALVPLFNYFFQSYEKSHIDQRRIELITWLKNNFTDHIPELKRFEDNQIPLNELKGLISELLKSKL